MSHNRSIATGDVETGYSSSMIYKGRFTRGKYKGEKVTAPTVKEYCSWLQESGNLSDQDRDKLVDSLYLGG